MEGRSHLLIGLTAGVVFDSYVHLSGPPLTTVTAVPLALLAGKAIYYFSVGFGALLPDIDNARSTMGRKFGVISEQIQHLVGHRTFFHSFLGLAFGSLLALGAGHLIAMLLSQRGYVLPTRVVDTSQLVFLGVLFGCVMHIAADALTHGGVPLFWPMRKRFGFPPDPDWRFRTGSWIEYAIVSGFMILVAVGVWQSMITI